MDELSQRLQNLPRELYNMVMDSTTLTFDDEVIIGKAMQIPVGLHINRATRAITAKKYYGNTIFVLPGSSSNAKLCSWLKSLPATHFRTIRTIRMGRKYNLGTSTLWWALRKTIRTLYFHHLTIGLDVLHIESSYEVLGGSKRLTEWLNSTELERRVDWEYRHRQPYDLGVIFPS